MDIYTYAETNDGAADYMDYQSGRIYKVAAYNRARRFGLPTPGIGVTDFEGNFLGYAIRMETSEKMETKPAENQTRAAKKVANIFCLESGISHAPQEIIDWFQMHKEFQIASVGPDFISVCPVGRIWCDLDWLTIDLDEVDEWRNVQCTLDWESCPRYIVGRYKGGNANAENGGFSICILKKRVDNTLLPVY